MFCDVKVRVRDEVFAAHRLVLAAQSKFLAALFSGGFKESSAPVVEINEMQPSIFAVALDYMYDGQCTVPDEGMLEHVLAAAALLQMDRLFTAAAAELGQRLAPENCARALAVADKFHLPQLAKKAEELAAENFVEVGSDASVPVSSMRALLASDTLNVATEQAVFETLSKWLKGQAVPPTEQEQICLFSLVRFPLLPKPFLQSTVMQEAALSTLQGHKVLLAQFQDTFFLDGPTVTARIPSLAAQSSICTKEQSKQVCTWLTEGAEDKALRLELLYRASRDGWAAQDFHSRCDGKGATITVIKCSGGFVFGGYADVPWSSHGGYIPSPKAFLFSLHGPSGLGPVKLPLVKNCHQNAMVGIGSFGPTFGGGHDLRVGNNANAGKSYTALGCSYHLPAGQSGRTFFTGAHEFRAAEVEVHQVHLQ